jgi:hypothetical protein
MADVGVRLIGDAAAIEMTGVCREAIAIAA